MQESQDREIERNLFAFLPQLARLLPDHEGSFALLKDQNIASIHKKLSDALKAAESQFSDGIFSVQRITAKPVELGMFSNAEVQR